MRVCVWGGGGIEMTQNHSVDAFCKKMGLRYKAVLETHKLRRQLLTRGEPLHIEYFCSERCRRATAVINPEST